MEIVTANDIEQARELEANGEMEKAAKLYENAIKHKTTDEFPYNRLMILYRKLKQPKDELRVINFAISVFEKLYERKSRNKKLTELSNALMKSTGLSVKGKSVYLPEPLNKWTKRKELLVKKMKK